jgi:thioester reductase-like protein
VYCLVRKESEELRSFQSSQIIQVIGNISRSKLGIEMDIYEEITRSVDLIIHCAAIVNHLVSYEDVYRTNVQSIFNIIDLALTSKIKPIHYVSSVSAIGEKKQSSMGYGASKWACDQLLQFYRSEFDLPVFIYRPSLVIGHSRTGSLNSKDWFHRFLRAIVDFKIIPQISELPEEPLNMVSVDFCAQCIVTLLNLPNCIGDGGDGGDDVVNQNKMYIFNIGYRNIGFKQIFEMMIDRSSPPLSSLPFELSQSPYNNWYSSIFSLVSTHHHPALPFIESFRHGLGASFALYDTQSLELALSICRSPLSFIPLDRSSLDNTIQELLRH